MNYMSYISENIRRAMFFANMNYNDLSQATGISPATLQRYGSGKTEKIPIDRLLKIASALNITTDELLIDPKYFPSILELTARDNGLLNATNFLDKMKRPKKTEETAPTVTDERDLEMLSLLSRLTPEQKEMLLLQIKGLLPPQE